jgi:hypothetical protein
MLLSEALHFRGFTQADAGIEVTAIEDVHNATTSTAYSLSTCYSFGVSSSDVHRIEVPFRSTARRSRPIDL